MAVNLLHVFNDHFDEFVTDVHNVFPDDVDILTAKKSLLVMRKMNPKLIAGIWKRYIADKYADKIEQGDISYFLEKDYSSDLTRHANSDQIMSSIDRLKGPIGQMSPENQAKTLKYIQNLTKLSAMAVANN